MHEIPPGGTYTLADYVLQSGDCVAGTFDLQCSAGLSCEVRAIACDSSHNQMSVYDLLPDAPSDGRDRRGIFDITGMSDVVDLSYSGTSASDAIGSRSCPRAATDPYGGPPYAGEYGILRTFDIIAQTTDAYVYQSAHGGSATATYFVNSTLWASHQIPAGERSKICEVGAGQSVSLVTMAEINSSYPLDLVVDQDDSTIADAGLSGSPMYAV
jgi:hypothetical protein